MKNYKLPDRKKFAIARWVNYKTTSIEGFEKAWKYITDPKSSKPDYQQYNGLRDIDTVDDFKSIEDRYSSDISGRLYKHFIISFGEPDLIPQKAMDTMKTIMEAYDDYPYVFAIHDNIPYRLHGHCIMGMRNINTGRRFEQSPIEFKRFNIHINDVLKHMGLPLLKRMNVETAINEMEGDEKPDDEVSFHSFLEDNCYKGNDISIVDNAVCRYFPHVANCLQPYPGSSQRYPVISRPYLDEWECSRKIRYDTLEPRLKKSYRACFEFAKKLNKK